MNIHTMNEHPDMQLNKFNAKYHLKKMQDIN